MSTVVSAEAEHSFAVARRRIGGSHEANDLVVRWRSEATESYQEV